MAKNIKKFEEYTQDPLMDNLSKIQEDDVDFSPKDWEIEEVIDVLTEDPHKSEDERIKKSIGEAITFDTQVPKDVTRGSYIWITAMIKRKSGNYNDPGRQAVIKLRVIDIFYGLAHLNKVINQ